MKNSTLAYLLVTSFMSLALMTGCSSASKDSSEEAVASVEASASGDEFNALVDSDASTGAVVDESSPVLVADSGYQTSMSDASPVNLGASSAGRAH